MKDCVGLIIYFYNYSSRVSEEEKGYLFSYLGFLTTAMLSLRSTYSQARMLLLILTTSFCVLAGSASKEVLAASGSAPNSKGTGPPMTSPSNSVAFRGQDPKQTVGMLSL